MGVWILVYGFELWKVVERTLLTRIPRLGEVGVAMGSPGQSGWSWGRGAGGVERGSLKRRGGLAKVTLAWKESSRMADSAVEHQLTTTTEECHKSESSTFLQGRESSRNGRVR